MGQVVGNAPPLTWGGAGNANVLWKVPLPGTEANAGQDQNQSSPVVAGGRVFVTASYWPGKVDAARHPEHHVACYRATDGKLLWDVTVPPGGSTWIFTARLSASSPQRATV